MRSLGKILVLIVTIACAVQLSSANVFAQDSGNQPHKGLLANLTIEQKEALHTMVQKMRSENATPDEIRDATQKMLKGYGIQVPDGWPGPMGQGFKGPWANLTDEQRQSIHAKIQELRSQGASRQEIGSAMKQMLQGYGIKVPEGNPGRMVADFKGPLANLTDEQRAAIHAKVQELRSQNASNQDVVNTVKQMLEGYGIKVPDGWQGPWGGGFRGMGANLTDAQREEVRSKTKEMKSQGASRQEIHQAVVELIAGYTGGSETNSSNEQDKSSSTGNSLIAQNFPNPFNPETDISYSMVTPAGVKMEIFNVNGQLVRSFDEGFQAAGNYIVHWDGRDSGGNGVASGVYFYRISAGAQVATKRMIMLK